MSALLRLPRLGLRPLGLGLSHGTGGVLPYLPPGYAFRVDYDGKYIIDTDGNYEVEPV